MEILEISTLKIGDFECEKFHQIFSIFSSITI